MSEDRRIDFGTMLEVVNPHDSFSFLQGFLEACRLFGQWKNGEQFMGVDKYTVREVKKMIEEFTRQEL